MNMTSTTSSVQNAILIVLAIVIILICAGCIYSFIRAIFYFIFSQGKDEKIKKAWNSIRYMIMGIFLSVAFLFVFPLIFKWLGLDEADTYSAKNIFNKAGELLKGAFQLKDVIRESQMDNQYRGDFYYNVDTQADKFVDDYTL